MARTASDIRRWRKYLAAERAEAAVYRDLASSRTGQEREILLALCHVLNVAQKPRYAAYAAVFDELVREHRIYQKKEDT